MPNGNIYITEGISSRFLEITTQKEKVWEYDQSFISYIFRSEKYPSDFEAFEGRDLTPDGTIENPSSSVPCQLVTNTNGQDLSKRLDVDISF